MATLNQKMGGYPRVTLAKGDDDVRAYLVSCTQTTPATVSQESPNVFSILSHPGTLKTLKEMIGDDD
jgi:hypothetical protein